MACVIHYWSRCLPPADLGFITFSLCFEDVSTSIGDWNLLIAACISCDRATVTHVPIWRLVVFLLLQSIGFINSYTSWTLLVNTLRRRSWPWDSYPSTRNADMETMTRESPGIPLSIQIHHPLTRPLFLSDTNLSSQSLKRLISTTISLQEVSFSDGVSADLLCEFEYDGWKKEYSIRVSWKKLMQRWETNVEDTLPNQTYEMANLFTWSGLKTTHPICLWAGCAVLEQQHM